MAYFVSGDTITSPVFSHRLPSVFIMGWCLKMVLYKEVVRDWSMGCVTQVLIGHFSRSLAEPEPIK